MGKIVRGGDGKLEKVRRAAAGSDRVAVGESPDPAILTKLRELRRLNNWSQREMAGRLAVTEEAYRAMEAGRTVRLEWDTVSRLMDVMANTHVPLGEGDVPSSRAKVMFDLRWLLGHVSGRPMPEPVEVKPQPRRKRGYVER